MSKVVVFRAPCPRCGRDCRWQQSSDEAVVHPEDFTTDCVCDAV